MDERFFSQKKAEIPNLASSPDARAHYTADQDRWIAKSNAVMEELLDLLNKHPIFPKPDLQDVSYPAVFKKSNLLATEFGRIYLFLAKKRQEIAALLGQRKELNRTNWYGALRNENFTSFETIYACNEKVWPEQKDMIYEHVANLLKNINEDDYDEDGDYDGDNVFANKKTKMIDDQEVTIHTITIKAPSEATEIVPKCSSLLSTIIFFDFHKDKTENVIKIEYTPINKYDLLEDFKLADYYLKSCRAATNKDDFLINAGRFSHLLAHLLPVKLGNAAITEWIVRTLAKEKNLDLGPFSFQDKISWDIKALLTPSREEYAIWYAKSAFLQVQELRSAVNP